MLARGQEFSFQMYFEDALGNRDTLTIGYDPNGSRDSILPEFGEENLAHIPFDSVFDVRISNQTDLIIGHYEYELFHSKVKIVKYFEKVILDIKTKNWPVIAEWDSSLFNKDSLNGSIFTSYHPMTWWDAGSPYSNLDIINLLDESQVSFTANYPNNWQDYLEYPEYGFLNYYLIGGDVPVSNFYVAFGDSSLLTTNIDLLEKDLISFYPNPTLGEVYLSGDLINIKQVAVYDLKGRLINKEFERNYIDISHLKDGIYLLVVKYNNGERVISKIAKTNR